MIDFDSAPSSPGNRGHLLLVPNGPAGESPRAPKGGGHEPPSEPPAYILALNDRQREAATTTDGPLIVLAGAGSGKTKMLTARIAYLIDALHVPAYQILAVTFTNKAAGEMRERVERALHDSHSLGAPEIGTFHAICMRILRREMAYTPFTKPFVIYDDSDQLALIKATLEKLGIDDKAFSPKAIQGAINRAKCDALEPQDIEPAAHDIFARQLKRAYEQYQKDLFANNALDFGEIICLTYRLFRDHADVRRKYQHRYRYIHVDEYQDTNRAQYLLLAMLTQAKYGGHQNICVVGDEDQSIYKWRGADIRNILDFEHDYPGAAVVKLEQNYRSTQTIIQAAGQVIRNNRERKDKTLWTDNERGVPIVRAQLPDERAEAELVVGEIKRLAANEGRGYGDFAIFYRTHAQSRQFEDTLRREKIPYQIVGGLRFYDRKEIKDVLAYFRVILNPADSISIKRVINVPARGIGKTTLDKIDAHQQKLEREGAPESTFWAALSQAAADREITSAGTSKKLAVFTDLIERLMSEQPKLLLSELYHLILDETGYVRELRQEGTEESLARIENLEEFDTLLQEFEEDFFGKLPPNEDGTELTDEQRAARRVDLLPAFLEEAALVNEAQSSEEDGLQAVKMMSLHSSKGLEFPVVFMAGMEEGLFPSIRAWEDVPDDEIEEERRLCYVGMTRAREQLYMLHVVVRRIWGNVTYQEPARFFQEIADDHVDFRDLSYGSAAQNFRAGSSKHFSFRDATRGSGVPGKAAFRGSSDDDVESAPAYDDFSQVGEPDGDDLVGRKIQHPSYGLGTILAVEGSGMEQKVNVEFAGRDRRKFVLRYVKDYVRR